MQVLDRNSALWNYMPEEIRELFEDGEIILTFVHRAKETASPEADDVSDYSFMVFPFAKGYEGFLKRFFLDSGLIKEEEYYGDEIRIGRILNPSYKKRDSVFNKICGSSQYKEGKYISKLLWKTWKNGRNLVFHYFPHNYRRLSYDEALDIINDIVNAMSKCVTECKINIKNTKKQG